MIFLEGFSGILITDGYSGYNKVLCRAFGTLGAQVQEVDGCDARRRRRKDLQRCAGL